MGEKLRFYLSHGLFSSFSIDAGTMLLLKTVAQHLNPENYTSILDSGCGTGVIAISLKKKFPLLQVTASDRDALALQFTSMNTKLNGMPADSISIIPGLLPGSLESEEKQDGRYDLILSNIPAKAGNPVIADFIQNCGYHLNNDGIAAVVIVEPLSDFTENEIKACGAELLYSEKTPQYTVFHFKPADLYRNRTRTLSFEKLYGRTVSGSGFTGFYGLPEFDSVSYASELLIDTLKDSARAGKILFWNPGQGHITSAYSALNGTENAEIILAGNDLLQLKAAAFNLGERKSSNLHLPVYSELSMHPGFEGSIKEIAAVPLFVPGADAEAEIIETSLKILSPGGKLIIAGKSSDMAKIERVKGSFSIIFSRKYRGFRVMVLKSRPNR